MTDQEYTSADAADILGIAPRTVRWACKTGRMVGARRHGREWAIPLLSIRRYELEHLGRPGRKPRSLEKTR